MCPGMLLFLFYKRMQCSAFTDLRFLSSLITGHLIHPCNAFPLCYFPHLLLSPPRPIPPHSLTPNFTPSALHHLFLLSMSSYSGGSIPRQTSIPQQRKAVFFFFRSIQAFMQGTVFLFCFVSKCSYICQAKCI